MPTTNASRSAGHYPQPHPIFPKVIGIDWKPSNIVEFHRRFGNSIRKCFDPPMEGGCGGGQPQRICLQPPHSPWIFCRAVALAKADAFFLLHLHLPRA
jgi:hypothetical protein